MFNANQQRTIQGLAVTQQATVVASKTFNQRQKAKTTFHQPAGASVGSNYKDAATKITRQIPPSTVKLSLTNVLNRKRSKKSFNQSSSSIGKSLTLNKCPSVGNISVSSVKQLHLRN